MLQRVYNNNEKDSADYGGVLKFYSLSSVRFPVMKSPFKGGGLFFISSFSWSDLKSKVRPKNAAAAARVIMPHVIPK